MTTKLATLFYTVLGCLIPRRYTDRVLRQAKTAIKLRQVKEAQEQERKEKETK